MSSAQQRGHGTPGRCTQQSSNVGPERNQANQPWSHGGGPREIPVSEPQFHFPFPLNQQQGPWPCPRAGFLGFWAAEERTVQYWDGDVAKTRSTWQIWVVEYGTVLVPKDVHIALSLPYYCMYCPVQY